MFEKLKTRTLKTSKFKDMPNAKGGSTGPSLTATSADASSGFTTLKGNEAERLVRCRHCGFICDKERDVYYADDTYAGFGISQGTQMTAGISIGDRNVPETSLSDHWLYWNCEATGAVQDFDSQVGNGGQMQTSNLEDYLVTGKVGNGYSIEDLGGEGSNWILVKSDIDEGSLKGYDEFSIACWFKADSTGYAHHIIHEGLTGTAGWSSIGSAAMGSNPEMHLSLGWVDPCASREAATVLDRSDFLTFYLGNWTTDVEGQISIGYAFTDTASWHHVAVSVSSLSTLPYARMWIDGVHRDRDWGTVTGCNRSGFDTGLRVGAAAAEGTNPFYGDVDDIRIFSKAINTLEVLAIYNSGAGTTRYGSSVTSVDQYYDRNVSGGCPCCGAYNYV